MGAGPAYSPPSASFTHAAASFADAPASARRPSMAETLQATFGGSDRLGGRAAQRIGDAYGKFKAFGL
jgi:hypothetical protein